MSNVESLQEFYNLRKARIYAKYASVGNDWANSYGRRSDGDAFVWERDVEFQFFLCVVLETNSTCIDIPWTPSRGCCRNLESTSANSKANIGLSLRPHW